ncbi:MAG: hypothetical protein WD071_17375 [Pseudohongiella sp.]|uniref:hypothetical protein n=1 Tax=Pseudohongiella sp. TaxID=1979412 RepID=UPI0034A06775
MAFLALALNVAGVGLLYWSWRHQSGVGVVHAPTGWGFLLLSAWAWMLASGAEFGVVQVFLFSGVIAWLLVLLNYRLQAQSRQLRGKGTGRSRDSDLPTTAGTATLHLPHAKAFARQLWLFIVVVPLAGAASALFTTVLVQLLPWQQGDKLVFTLYAVPVVWGIASWWACAAPRSYWPPLSFMLALIVSFLFLYG